MKSIIAALLGLTQSVQFGKHKHIWSDIKPEDKFQLYSRLEQNRVLYVDEAVDFSDMNQLRARRPWNTAEEYFVFNEETQTIRSALNHNLVVAAERLEDPKHEDVKAGIRMVVRPYTGSEEEMFRWDHHNDDLINFAQKTLCVALDSNEESGSVMTKLCKDDDMTEKWWPHYEWQPEGSNWVVQAE